MHIVAQQKTKNTRAERAWRDWQMNITTLLACGCSRPDLQRVRYVRDNVGRWSLAAVGAFLATRRGAGRNKREWGQALKRFERAIAEAVRQAVPS